MIEKLKTDLMSLLELAQPLHPDLGWSKSTKFHHAHSINNASTELQTALLLFGLVIRHQPEKIVELGSHRGLSGAWMIAAMETYGGGHFIGYDIVDHKRMWKKVADKTTTEFRQSPVWDAPPAGPIDLVFHDSDHTMESTERELSILRPLVRPGGLLIMHDTTLCDCGVVSRKWSYTDKDWQFIDLKNARGLTIAQKRWSSELTPEGNYKI